MAGVGGIGSGYASAPHDTVEKFVEFVSTAQAIRSGSLVLLFLFAVVNRKIWFGLDTLLTTLAGLVLVLCPQCLLEFQISRQVLDGVDLQVARMIGCVLLGNSVLWFLATKRTKDPESVHPSLLLTRVITNGVLLIAIIDIQLFSKAWGPEHLTFGALGVLLWGIGNLVHLVRGGYPGGHLQIPGRGVNHSLLSDFAISVFVGFTLYGFPRWFLRNFTLVRTLDGAHEHLTRALGAAIFGTGLFAFQAVGFKNIEDKQAHFIQRITINLLLMASTVFAQTFYFREWNITNNWAVVFALTLWTIHAYLGLQSEPYQIRYTSGPNRVYQTRERIVTSVGDRSGLKARGGLVPEYDRED
ncbi:hypothetical protein BV898_11289 [Hypsibius exemplaris]|uniref:Uncharacterized protein n=1 Tax=Hypsibius exemplaris TaxID=2072580 RepID=A0A1W0WHA3_HYPEX|nr:hypothetical protein BV898_11289 [Hypsibius exemplaris]